MNQRIILLMLAYVFPPALGSGTFRPLSFANNLQASGLNVIVLTASDYTLDESAIDHTLCDKLNPHVEVYRARRYRSPKEFVLKIREIFNSSGNKAKLRLHEKNISPSRSFFHKVFDPIKNIITELLSYPDNQIGWAVAAYMLGRRIIRDKKIDIVFATGGPWSSLLTAILLKKFARVPVVLDYRDPWVSNPNNLNRSSTIKKLNKIMEAFCIRNCDAIIANTDELHHDFLNRYSFLNPMKVHTITNGIDSLYTEQNPRNEKFTITHAGVLYLNRSPKQFLIAIREIISQALIPQNKIQINFVGDLTNDDEEVATLLSDRYLKDVVRLIPSVSHDKALIFQKMSDVLMLIQPNFPLQVPRKLYEYLALRRPILAITEQSGATANLIRKTGIGVIAENDVSEIKYAILNLYQSWISSSYSEVPKEKLLQFDNSILADKLRDVIAAIVAKKK